MLNISAEECIDKINRGEHFHAEIEGGFQLKIEK